MRKLYEASSAVEAHMLADVLKQRGIDTQIQGEHLQGAIGELPAAGLVRLVVEESDYEKARTIIGEWEAAQPVEPLAPRPKPNDRPWMMLVGGLIVGAVLAYAYHRVPGTTAGVDHNRDGVLDERWTYSLSGKLVKYEADRNLDKKIDFIGRYDERGTTKSAEQDDDFDGAFETRTLYSFGNAIKSESDTNNDGIPDVITHYKNGVMASVEYINAANGFPQRIEHYRLGAITHVDIDTDLDGKLDRRNFHTFFGAISRSEKLAQPSQ